MTKISGDGSVNPALPDTSMRLSEYVLQTFLLNIFSLAISNFSNFKMANAIFKMAVKLSYFTIIDIFF